MSDFLQGLDLKVEQIPVDKLVPYARNARTHSEDQIDQIAASISEFGFVNPVLISEDKGLIAGHGRLMAAISHTSARSRLTRSAASS